MYTIQYGIDMKGRFTTMRGKAEAGMLVVTQKSANDIFTVKTDEVGNFYVPDLLLYDTAKLAVHPKTAGGGRGGKVVVDTTIVRPPPTPADTLLVTVSNGTNPKPYRDRPGAMPARVLKPVEVSSTRIAPNQPASVGFADAVVDGEFFRSTAFTDMLMALQSKVPGLRIMAFVGPDAYPKKYILFGANSSLGSLEAQEPLVLIDGLRVNEGGGGTADRISLLNPNEIDRIEVTKFGNSAAYGARGGNGVIAIYTRNLRLEKNRRHAPLYKEEKLVTLNIPGYASPRKFAAPDHSAGGDVYGIPDYRATLYWNPLVVLDQDNRATITFFAADLATRYRIVVEGFTTEGVPVRGEKIITVKER